MRKCTKCGKIKPLSEFWRKKRGPEGRDTQCAICKREYHRKIYENSSKRRRDIQRNSKRWVKKKRDLIKRYKEFVGCQDCGKKFPYYTLEFDHVTGDKEFTIGTAVGSHNIGLERIKKEIRKCEIVCANCHRERTYSPRA